eukprot:36567_1
MELIETNDNCDENVDQTEENEDIINELIKLGFANKDEILNAMKIVINKKDINSIVEQIEENRSKSQLETITNEMKAKNNTNHNDKKTETETIKTQPETKENKENKENGDGNTYQFPVSVYV